MISARPETVSRETLAQYLSIIDELIAQPFPETEADDDTGYGGPTYRVRGLRMSQDFWDDAYHKAWHEADADMRTYLDALVEALTSRWGAPLVVDVSSYLTAGYGGLTVPEPIDRLSQMACEMQAWAVPGTGRWLGLTIGQHDTELPLELVAAVARTPVPAPSAADGS